MVGHRPLSQRILDLYDSMPRGERRLADLLLENNALIRHDTQIFASIAPAGLIFVPSVGGLSHAPDETMDREAIEKGTTLLAAAMAELASR
jgi:acetylornithine deacetylase/succinyl-diaminopimelate desuccinylase-like protein